MTAAEQFPHPFVILDATADADPWGDPTADDWSAPEASSPLRGWMAERATTEVVDGRRAVVVQTVLRLPTGAPVKASSRIRDERDGQVYTVEGEPYVVPGRNGPDHVRVILQRVDG